MLPETALVVPPLQAVPGSRVREAAIGSLVDPLGQKTVDRPLLGATTRSEMASVIAGPATWVCVPHGPLFGGSMP